MNMNVFYFMLSKISSQLKLGNNYNYCFQASKSILLFYAAVLLVWLSWNQSLMIKSIKLYWVSRGWRIFRLIRWNLFLYLFQVLDLGGNNLQILPREVFSRHGLLNLQKLKLSHCKIGQIDPTAFRGLTNLVELDLSSNLLTSVPTPTFSGGSQCSGN